MLQSRRRPSSFNTRRRTIAVRAYKDAMVLVPVNPPTQFIEKTLEVLRSTTPGIRPMQEKREIWHATQQHHISLSAPQHIDSCEKQLKASLRAEFETFGGTQLGKSPPLLSLSATEVGVFHSRSGDTYFGLLISEASPAGLWLLAAMKHIDRALEANGLRVYSSFYPPPHRLHVSIGWCPGHVHAEAAIKPALKGLRALDEHEHEDMIEMVRLDVT